VTFIYQIPVLRLLVRTIKDLGCLLVKCNTFILVIACELLQIVTKAHLDCHNKLTNM